MAGLSASRYYYECTAAKTHMAGRDGHIDEEVNGFRLVAQVPATTACGRYRGTDDGEVPKRRVSTIWADVDCKLCLRKIPATAWERLA